MKYGGENRRRTPLFIITRHMFISFINGREGANVVCFFDGTDRVPSDHEDPRDLESTWAASLTA